MVCASSRAGVSEMPMVEPPAFGYNPWRIHHQEAAKTRDSSEG
jgi:hypothetical protein